MKKNLFKSCISLLLGTALLFSSCSTGIAAEGSNSVDTAQKSSDSSTTQESSEDAAASNSARPLPSTSGSLHVEGTALMDSNGDPIQLKGISTHGLAWFPQYINNDCFRQLREDFNANVVRLAMYTSDYDGYCNGGDQEALKQLIRDGVSYATENDMYVIIDWHILSDGNPNTHKDASIEFFAEMSAEYADAENVLYEICNEPNGGTTWAEIKSYAIDVIDTIRANDSDGIILVGTPNWSQFVDQAAADPITGYENIMYTLHYYAATHKDDLRSTMVNAIENGLPVFVSEYGICDASGNGAIDEAQANLWTQVMDEYGVSYVAWNLSNKEETSAIFRSDCTKTSGFSLEDLSESGMWVYEMLTKDKTTDNANNSADTDTTDSSNNTKSEETADISDTASGSDIADHSGDNEMSDPSESSGTSDTSASENSENSDGSTSSSTGTDGIFEYTAEVVNSWESEGKSFYQYNVSIQNTSDTDCTQWSIDIPFNGEVTLSDGWNGDYTVNGTTLHITSKSYNGTIASGNSVSDVGFIVSGGADLEIIDTSDVKNSLEYISQEITLV